MTDSGSETRQASGAQATALVGGGLVLLGVSASAFLVLAARAVGPSDFAGLAVLWTLVYTLGIGLFVPFEQEVARALAARRARGEGGAPVVARAVRLAGLLLGATTVGALLLSSVLLDWLGGSWVNLLALLLACAALAGQYLARGVYAGSGRFGPYSLQISTEGAVRLLLCAGLVVAGVSTPAPYALLLAGAPLVSLLVTAAPFKRLATVPGPPAPAGETTVNLGWLIGAALAAQGLANLGTLAVTVLSSPAEEAAAGHFLAGFTIARSPLFAFAAVQAVLLPGLTRHLARGHHAGFRRQLGLVMSVTVALGVLGVAGSFLLGPEILGLLFGPAFEMSRADLALLALSSAVYMVALVLQPAVIALSAHRGNALAWITGLVAFGAVLLLPFSTFLRVELGLIFGATLVCAVLAWFLVHGVRRLDEHSLDPDPATYRLGME